MTLYETLGVSQEATTLEIRSAYRKLAKEHHPDKGGDKAKFQRIKHAYETLKDSARRKLYDETGDDSEPGADPIEKGVLELIGQLFDEVIVKEFDNEHALRYVNIPKTMLENLLKIEKGARESGVKGEKLLKSLRKSLGRIKKHPERNLVKDIMSARINTLERQIAAFEAQLKILTITKDILKGYEFETEPAPEGMEDEGNFHIFGLDQLHEQLAKMAGHKRRRR